MALTPAADAFVRADRPGRNFGGKRVLQVGSRPRARAYLRFRLPRGVEVKRAVLRVFAQRRSRGGLKLQLAASRRWREKRLTFSSAPRAGRTILRSVRLKRGWNVLDVTGAVRGRSAVTFVLGGGGTRPLTLRSRDAGARGPRLLLHRAGAPAAGAPGGGSGPGQVPAPSGALTPWPVPPPVDRSCPRPYSDASPWNRPIGGPDTYHPASALHVGALVSGNKPLSSDPTQYTYPVYEVTAGTPVETVTLNDGWFSNVTDGGTRLDNQRMKPGTVELPIPAGAQAAAGSDAQMIMLDRATGDEWGVSNLVKTAGGWQAYNAYHYNTGWTGVPPYDRNGKPFFPRGAGVPYLAGLVRPCEIARGYIDHALAFAYDFPTGDFVYPATKSDGDSVDPADMPEGARLQLDPAITEDEIRGWGCTGPCFIVARALQTYGMYIIDNAGRPKVMMEYESTARWGGVVSSKTPNPIPLDRFTLIQWPAG